MRSSGLALGCIAACSAAMSLPLYAQQPTDRPNFVVLLVDDLGYGDTGFTGNPHTPTPGIDALAASGMVFTQGYAPAPQCSPSRASILTGQYPGRIGVTTWIAETPEEDKYRFEWKGMKLPEQPNHLPEGLLTLGNLLGDAGYATINLGKWHLGQGEHAPIHRGFDEQPGYWPWSYPKSWFSPYGIKTLSEGPKGEYLTDRLTDEAIGFIDRNQDKPFFMMFQYYAVHSPLAGKPELVEQKQAQGLGIDKKDKPNARYEAMKVSLDESVGRVLEALRERGLDDETVVVFLSDNGGVGWASNEPYRGVKKTFYEGGIHSPFVVRWPGVTQPNSTSDVPVSGMDLLPTFLEMAGLTPPPSQPVDGESLVPVLRGEGLLKRETLFWHFPQRSFEGAAEIVPQGVVRQGSYKLIVPYHPSKPVELYDLEQDPKESQNLAQAQPERVEQMRTLLIDHLKSTGARMPEPNHLF